MIKRLTDFTAALALTILFSPLLALISLLILVTEGLPIFFLQVRVGRNLERFRIVKFRTMRPSPAPASGGDLPPEATPEQIAAARARYQTTAAGDRRITPVGAFLRKTSLDELPQLFNVLKGDMSLVGPRPDVPAQQADYREEDWRERHRVRPGITGLAQVNGRSEETEEERHRADLEYVRNQSLWLDLKILLRTVGVVVRAKEGN